MNIDVITLENWRPGSVRQARPSPIGKEVPGTSDNVSSPGMSPSSHTD